MAPKRSVAWRGSTARRPSSWRFSGSRREHGRSDRRREEPAGSLPRAPAARRFRDIIRDQSQYIKAALHEIQKHLVVGSILASAVVLLFMRSWRSTLIAAVAIPPRS